MAWQNFTNVFGKKKHFPSMERNLDHVIEEALSLDEASKLLLAEKLLSKAEPESGHQEEWNREIHRRIEEIRLGNVQTYDAFEMIRETREQLGI